MMQSMKGATSLLGSMNRQMNLPALQRIAMEFEKENDIMDQRQEMMDDAIDDVTGLEDEEEGDEVVNKVLDEIGVDLGQAVGPFTYPESPGKAQLRVLVGWKVWKCSEERILCLPGLIPVFFRWERRRPVCRKPQYPMAEWHRQ